MANIKDVAKYAGVGLGTVSRYLNGYNVTEANKMKIEQAIKDLDFVVNPIARSMKTKKTMTIAIVVPRLANTFSMRIIESIENYLEPFGYSIIVCDCGEDGKKEIERLKFTADKMVDGIVLMTSNTKAEKVKKAVKDIPLVLIDRVFDTNYFDSITAENFTSSYTAISECINNGDSNIAILAGPQNISTARERLYGVKKAFEDKHIALDENMIFQCKFQISDGYNTTKKVLRSNPDAIFASNYEITIGTIKALNEEKKIIGRDIKLIGIDNLELIDVYPYSMTVISQPMEEMGREAAKFLLKRIENMDAPLKNIVLSNKIIRT